MKFTDRYLSIPIKTFDPDEKYLGVNAEEDSILKINPYDISCYYTAYKKDVLGVYIVLKSGDTSFTNLTISEFEDILNNFNP